MAYASNSFGGGCPPTYLVSAISSSAMTATFSDLTEWVEVDSTGAKTSQPLGTSGSFCIKLDYGLATEETVKCTSLNPSTGVITFATRGFDGTTAKAHAAGSSSKLNVFPVDTATDWVNLQATATTASTTASSALSTANTAQTTANTGVTNAAAAQSTANTAVTNAATAQTTANTAVTNAATAQSTANSKVASVTAADGTITVAGTGTAPTVKVGTVPYSQLSGTPSTLPPSGSAGGDLTGTYPNPTLAVNRLALTGGTLTGTLNGTAATFSSEVTATDFKATGLTGATAASRYVGGTTSGAPTSGTFVVGDFIIDQTATIWVCIAAGTPGNWAPTESQNVRSTGSSTTAAIGEIIITTGGSTGVLITLPTSAVGGSTFGIINDNNNNISIKGGTYPLLIAGNNYGAGISYTVSPKGIYLFVFDNVANRWICTSTNDIGDMVNYGDVTLDKFGAPAANLPMNAKKITGLADGTASTDAAAFGQVSVKANSAITISTTAPLSGGGDLSANRTLTIADGTTSVKGAVQLNDSTSSTSTTTAATPNSVKTAYDLAAAALPKSGGTMSGAIAMGSSRITGLALPGASTDALQASQGPTVPNSGIHTNIVQMKAWTSDPASTTVYTSNTYTTTSGVHVFAAISIPYAMTLSTIWVWQTTGASAGASGAFYGLGIYSTAGTLLAQTGNQVSSGFIGVTGLTGWSLSSTYTIQPGNYMIGFLWYAGTGGSPVAPILGKLSNAPTAQVNSNCPTPSSGKLDQRGCTVGTGQTSMYSSITGITPTAANSSLWMAVG